MGFWSRPKGTIVESRAEWESLAMASGGGDVAPAGGTYSALILFNNSPGGESLFVYSAFFGVGTPGNAVLFFQQGPGSNLLGPATSIYSDGQAPPGLVYGDQLAAAPPASAAIFTQFASGPVTPLNAPIAVVRGNQSLVMQCTVIDTELFGGFFYRHGKA